MRPDILFVNPPSSFSAFESTKLAVYKQAYPLLSFMALSAFIKRGGFQTALLDLGIEKEPYKILQAKLRELKPRFLGLTAATTFFPEAIQISQLARALLGKELKIIAGGPHVSALPQESLVNSEMDIAVVGEGEETLLEILQGRKLAEVAGIFFKEGGQIFSTPPRRFIDDLDALPYPDFSIYDLKKYHCSELVSRFSPVLQIETSRGCPSDCRFCSQGAFKRSFRKKSAQRVVKEIKYFIQNGAKELRIIDDQFTADLERAKEICRLLIKEQIIIPWCLPNGVRVDRVDQEFFNLAKQAGCYQVSIGFESGDQNSLNSINKGITLEQSAKCLAWVKQAGLESIGFFMIGLPADTEESLKRTIAFAVKMMPTYAKVSVMCPYPGSQIFTQYEKEGRIKTRDWSKYNRHKIGDIFEHPNLSPETLRRYQELFYRRFYLNPKFIWARILKSLKEGTFWRDAYYGLKTFLPE